MAKHTGLIIREARMKAGLSQGDVQDRTGLKRTYLSRMESGGQVPRLTTLFLLKRFMDFSIDGIVDTWKAEE